MSGFVLTGGDPGGGGGGSSAIDITSNDGAKICSSALDVGHCDGLLDNKLFTISRNNPSYIVGISSFFVQFCRLNPINYSKKCSLQGAHFVYNAAKCPHI